MVQALEQTFGVEIECYLPEGMTIQGVAAAVTHRTGRPCNFQGYNHQTPAHWKVVTDASLGDVSRGVEFVSPILRGEAGIAEAEKVMRALADMNCTVSKRCGFHVHVGVDPAPLDFWKRLVNLYAGFEPVLDSIMPPSRRASRNTYARSITTASPSTINAALDFNAIQRAACGAVGNEHRFYKLNLAAYRRHRTVEYRHHAGTLDSAKAKFWILTCLRMTAAAHNGAVIRTGAPAMTATQTATQPGPILNRAREHSKSWLIGQMMLRPEGVTAREASAAVGWPSVSLPQQAQICGLTCTTQRTGREVRYFARAAQIENAVEIAAAPETATPPTQISLLGLIDLIGSDTAEAAYMLQRQTDLGGPIEWAA